MRASDRPPGSYPKNGCNVRMGDDTSVGQRTDRSIEAYGQVNGGLPADGIWLDAGLKRVEKRDSG